MSSSIGLTPRYALTIGASFLFWIVPINVKAPKFVTFLGFLASGCGYLYAFSLATPMSDQRWYAGNKKLQEREILLHDLAVEEMSLKQAIEAQYLGQAEIEPAAIAPHQTRELEPVHAPKMLPSAQIPDHLKFIVELAQQSEGKVTVRQVQRAFRQLSADQIKALFEELAKRQFGTVKSDKNSVVFELSR